jgi:hypothetical protein
VALADVLVFVRFYGALLLAAIGASGVVIGRRVGEKIPCSYERRFFAVSCLNLHMFDLQLVPYHKSFPWQLMDLLLRGRRKLGAAGDYIETARGVGYRFRERDG